MFQLLMSFVFLNARGRNLCAFWKRGLIPDCLVDFFISCSTRSELHRMALGSKVNILFKLMKQVEAVVGNSFTVAS